jgi:hypothetical protein
MNIVKNRKKCHADLNICCVLFILTLILLSTFKLNVIIQSVVAPLKAHQILVMCDPSMNEL